MEPASLSPRQLENARRLLSPPERGDRKPVPPWFPRKKPDPHAETFPDRVKLVCQLLETVGAGVGDWAALFDPVWQEGFPHSGPFRKLERLPIQLAKYLGETGHFFQLPGLKELDPTAARHLMRHRTTSKHAVWMSWPREMWARKVDLSHLPPIGLETAKVLYADRHELALPLVRELDVELATMMVGTDTRSLDLSAVKEVSDEVVRILSGFKGYLELSGIGELDPYQAELLSAHDGLLALDGLKTLELDVAARLFRHKCPMSLEGLEDLDREVLDLILDTPHAYYLLKPLRAKVFSTGCKLSDSEHEVLLEVLRGNPGSWAGTIFGTLEERGASRVDWYRLFSSKHLQMLTNQHLDSLSALHRLPPFLAECLALGFRGKQLNFDGLQTIDMDTLSLFANSVWHQVKNIPLTLSLQGLRQISPRLGHALANFPGEIILGYPEMEEPTRWTLKKGKAKVRL